MILADEDVTVGVVLRDAWNNVTDGYFEISTDAPGALVIGNRVTNLTQAGSYEIVASIPGTTIADSEALTIGPGTSASVVLAASKSAIRAGESLAVSATVYDAYGNEIPGPGAPVTFDVLGLAGETFTADAGANAGTFTLLNAAGSYTVEAKLGGGNPPLDTEPLLISPAAAASIVLIPSGATTIAPGGSVTLTTQVRDAFSNLTTDPVSVTVNAPGAIIQQGTPGTWQISGITEAGSYSIVASVAGVPISDAEPLTVTSDATVGSLDLTLTAAMYDAGQTITGTAKVYDGFGNLMNPQPAITASTTIPGATVTVSGGAVTVTNVAQTGTFQITATSGGVSDPETVTIHDVTVPSVSLTGLTEGQAVGVDAGGASIVYPLTIAATDSVGISEIKACVTTENGTIDFAFGCAFDPYLRVYPNNTTSAVETPTLRVFSADTGEIVQVLVRVTDMAGNVSQVVRNVVIDPAANLQPSLAAGLTPRTVVEDGLFVGFQTDAFDCRVSGPDTVLTVGDVNNDTLTTLNVPATGHLDFGGPGTSVFPGFSVPSGIEFDDRNGDLYLVNQGTNDLFRFPGDGSPAVVVNTVAQPLNTGRHLQIQTQGPNTFLFVVETGTDNVRRYDITTPPTAPVALAAGNLLFVTAAGADVPIGITAGSTNLFVTSDAGVDKLRTASATVGGALADFLSASLFAPRGTATSPATLPRFADEIFTANRLEGGAGRSPITRVDQTDPASVATFAHGIRGATDATFCNDKLYLLYTNDDFSARVVEISGF